MAIVIGADGKSTVGGMTEVCNAFTAAAGGKLNLRDAQMYYDHTRRGPMFQVLRFQGVVATSGEPFSLVSDPIPPGASLAGAAEEMAINFVKGSI